MSKLEGMQALRLQMPERVPRTEYSAHLHWDLVKKVTGIEVDSRSGEEQKNKASSAFVNAWNYSFFWNATIGSWTGIFGDHFTRMGHAEYAAGGTDFDNVTSCPFDAPEDVLEFDPEAFYACRKHSELVQLYNDDYTRMEALFPDTVNDVGIYSSLISGLIDIFGWEMLLTAAGTDFNAFGEVANRYTKFILQYFEALADSRAEVVMMHDDIAWTSGAFIHPDFYRKFIFPNYKKLLQPLIDSNKIILYTSDGNFTQFIDDIAKCGVNGFVMEPMTDMKYIAEKYGKTHAFIGNVDTRALLSGTKEDIENEVRRCMDIGKSCPGFFLAVGNHIPSNTPVENVLYYQEIYEKLSKR